jgi:hypothetical protein
MKKLIIFSFVLISFVVLILFGSQKSVHANSPFFTYCAKLYSAGSNTKPFEFSMLNSKGTCPSGMNKISELNQAQLISDLNLISKTVFHNGWALGNYQTSIQDSSQPCTPSQPGCTP